jgi:hypothetical protein
MTIWIAASAFLVWALATASSPWAAIHVLSLALAFGLGYWRQVTWLWQGLAVGLTFNLAIALIWPGPHAGLVGNPNYFGVALAIGLAGALAYRIWWFIPVSTVGLWVCQSRTAFIGAAVAFFMWGIRRFPATAMCTALLCLLMILLVDKGEGSMSQRLGIWQMALNNMTLSGHGWGSFMGAIDALPVKINMTLLKAPGAYNDFIQLCFELGLGVIPLLIVVAYCLEGADNEARLIFWVYLAMSLTYFPLWVPVVGQFVAMSLGRMAASRFQERKSQWPDGYLKSPTI